MGTAAVFGIVPKGKTIPQTEYTNPTIIGMTSDGFPDNLEHLAKRFAHINKTKFPNQELDNEMIISILEDVVKEDPNWLFVDKLNNSSWVTYYGWLKIDDMNLHIEKYNDEDFSTIVRIS